MRIADNAIADLIDRVGGVYSYAIDYNARVVFLTTTAGERIELTFGDLVAWVCDPLHYKSCMSKMKSAG